MNIREYIESGILELYVAGSLPEDQKREVEQLAVQYPEVRKEITAIEEAFELYAHAHAKKPSGQVLENILSKIESGQKTSEKKTARTIPLNAERREGTVRILRTLAYAASILLLISLGLNVYYYNSYKRVQTDLAKLENDNLELAKQYQTMQANYTEIASEMDVLKNPDYMAVTMKGMPISPSSTAMVFWDKKSGTLYISANNLPQPENGKQYQLWALVGGKPVDAGVFTMNGNMQLMKNIPQADAFAVTLEPEGGSPEPHLDFLYVIGNV